VTDQIVLKPLFQHYMEEGFFILQYIGASGLIG